MIHKITIITTAACSYVDKKDFLTLLLTENTISPRGAEARVTNSECLGFVREQNKLLGIAGLKHPEPHYRERVALSSNTNLSESKFPFELGWVVITPSARGMKLSFPICEAIIKEANGAGVFATTSASNIRMHSTLIKLGFQRTGTEYPSKLGNEKLYVFTKQGAKQC